MIHIPITIVGFGMAGQFLLSHITQIVSRNQISIIDPDFIGGDLQRHYSSIHSNTTIQQTVTALDSLPTIWSQASKLIQLKGESKSTLPLGLLTSEIHHVGISLLDGCTCHYDTLNRAQWDSDKNKWNLILLNGASYTTDIICLCTGILPRQEDYGIPTIPLSKALNFVGLQPILRSGDTVTVLGSSHSGTLILKNLKEIPNINTTCIYKTQPFKYAKDGNANGIKEESAAIADSIQRGDYTSLKMISTNDLPALSKTFRTSSWIIQATGFKASFPDLIDSSGIRYTYTWDQVTGKSLTMESVYAFGACVTNQQGDVSIGAFAEQLKTRWPTLLERLKSI